MMTSETTNETAAVVTEAPEPEPEPVRELRSPVVDRPRGADGKLDEQALRRPEFRPDVPLVLSDGQTWYFPRPQITDFFPEFGADGSSTLMRGTEFGPDYDDLVDEYLEVEGGAAEALLLARLGFNLLVRNYRLEPRDARRLLRIKQAETPGVETNRAMWRAISEVVLGNAPKEPTPAG